MNLAVKYFVIVFCSLFTYRKLLNITTNKSKICILFLLNIAVALGLYFAREVLSYSIMLVMFIGIFAILWLIYRKSIKTTLAVALISFGVGLGIMTIVNVCCGLLLFLVKLIKPYDMSNELFIEISYSVTYIISLVCNVLVFRIKRFRKGIPTLQENINSDLLVYLGITILLIYTLLVYDRNDINSKNFFYVIPIIFAVICGVSLFFVWKLVIKKIYLERQKLKELHELTEEIAEKNNEIGRITEENKKLAAIVHRDNKIVLSMAKTMEDIVSGTKNEKSLSESREFFEYVNKELAARNLDVSKSALKCRTLSKTNITAVDGLLASMQENASRQDTELNFMCQCNLTYLLNNIVSETDFLTILADLLENSIIATKNCPTKKIQLELSLAGQDYELSISDSGAPFTLDVLNNFGMKQFTTHKDEGGSGIGLMTIVDLVKKYKAEYKIIEDFNSVFSKTIRITFNNKGIFAIDTVRKRDITNPLFL